MHSTHGAQRRSSSQPESNAREVVNAVPAGCVLVDPEGSIVSANRLAADLLGYTPGELQAMPLSALIPDNRLGGHPLERLQIRDPMRPADGSLGQWDRVALRHKTGDEIPVGVGLGLLALGGRPYAIAVVRHLDDERTEAVQAAERRFEMLFAHNAAGTFSATTDGAILTCNDALAAMFDFDSQEELGSLSLDDLGLCPADRQAWLEALRVQGALVNHEFRTRRRDGGRMWVSGSWMLIDDVEAERSVIVGTVIALTPHKRLERRLEVLAYHDPLTGLPNRRLLQKQAEQRLAMADGRGSLAALMFMDLRRFKLINDQWGHRVGDLALVQIARRLKDCSRASDTVARLGGDEFAVLLSDLEDEGDALAWAKRLTGALRAPLYVEGRVLRPELSVGIALYPRDATGFDELLSAADQANHEAAANPGTHIQLYRHAAASIPGRDLSRKDQLLRALEEDELQLVYQPIVTLGCGRLVGVEALVRWAHPTQGLLGASEFLPLAEYVGLGPALDRWVLSAALRQAMMFQELGGPDWVSVNLSSQSLADAELPEFLHGLMNREQLDSRRLILEITERAATRDPLAVAERLSQFDESGVQTAIDDFGAGHLSLVSLKHFPTSYLKIDTLLVGGIPKSAKDRELIGGVIGLAHRLGMRVIAEGVETRQQHEQLAGLGCDFAQGWLTGRPRPPEVFLGSASRAAGCQQPMSAT